MALWTLACGTCLDGNLTRTVPFLDLLPWVFWTWWALCLCLRITFRTELSREAAFPPDRLILLRWVGVWTIGFALTSFALEFSLYAPVIPIMGLWLLLSVIRLARGMSEKPSTGERLGRWLLLATMFATLVMAGVGVSRGRSPEYLAWHLQAFDTDLRVRREVSAQLIEDGADSVEPLIEGAERELARDQPFKEDPEAPYLHCLGQIGGERATDYLRGLVSGRVSLDPDEEESWRYQACFAFLEASGDTAEVEALYARSALQAGREADADELAAAWRARVAAAGEAWTKPARRRSRHIR
jgi:hypothetical protein